jgi:hypothetical protein
MDVVSHVLPPLVPILLTLTCEIQKYVKVIGKVIGEDRIAVIHIFDIGISYNYQVDYLFHK